ncbi:unnamed protein product [Prunus armeniaca]|uniref:Uncharacterized protein n=1 Tax=Prunus armeniaca TaxID=36596 RepID=A0A6J5TR66_PRUAR|nr:unnamed protein product [Prunus armeniaca]
MKSSKLENKDLIRIGPESGTNRFPCCHVIHPTLKFSLPPSRGPTRFFNVEASRNATWCGQHKLWAARAGILGCATRFLIPTGRRTCILIRCVYSILIFSGL